MPYHPSPEAQVLIDQIKVLEKGELGGASRPLPKHVAVIMDGNGRWAQERGQPRIEGHRAGIDSVRSVSRACRKLGIPYLTLYAFSTENWKRPKSEVAALMRMLRRFLIDEIPEMKENQICLEAIGDLKRLPLYVQMQLEKTRRITSSNSVMQLSLALSYGSRDEITQAVQAIARNVKKGDLSPDSITQETIQNHLFTRSMPDPDLLIRTSGEMRVSNFLLWQIAYAEFYITDILWPDFRDVNFFQAILAYLQRDRRFGGVHSNSKK